VNRIFSSLDEPNPRRVTERNSPVLALLTLPGARHLATCAALASGYFMAARLGLAFAFVNASATARREFERHRMQCLRGANRTRYLSSNTPGACHLHSTT
jgi:hypothetical protein